jgi:hypothetical protein
MIAVRYIGARQFYCEGAYGSKINFTKGETVLVPDDLAEKLLRHKDVYELSADTVDVQPAIIPTPNPNQEPDENVQAARDMVENMDTPEALVEYAATNFAGHKIDKRMSIPNMKTQVTRLIDLYGVT